MSDERRPWEPPGPVDPAREPSTGEPPAPRHASEDDTTTRPLTGPDGPFDGPRGPVPGGPQGSPSGVPQGPPRPWGAAFPPAAAPGPRPGPAGPAGPGGPPGPYLGLRPPPRQGPPPPPRGRVPGWLWPVVAVLALVLGTIGGAIGSVAYQELSTAGSPGRLSTGLGDGVRREAPLDPQEGSVPAVADELLPSTVQILVGGEEGDATGSGFVLNDQGHVVTNNHVVAAAADGGGTIRLRDSEGEVFDAEIVGRSPVYDLAVLYADEVRDLQPAALGSSVDLLIGEGVVAIGSPLGLTSTVTSGIVSAKDRPVTTGGEDDESSFINAVQTDAAINPGNSGGPLVNLTGQVVGVNSAIATAGGFGGSAGNIGVGFSIPIEQVEVTADQILRTGEARYPVIGAQVRTGGESEQEGALVETVNEGSPAAAAGLREGDVVTAIEDAPITDGVALIVAIRTYQPGDTVQLTVQRDGEEQTFDVELGSEVG